MILGISMGFLEFLVGAEAEGDIRKAICVIEIHISILGNRFK
jgi:hypothetical protein